MADITLRSPLDTVHRCEYPCEADYLEAATNLQMKRNSPEFKKAFKEIQSEFAERGSNKIGRGL